MADYAISKAIAEHGVHPSKASGDLYRIKLWLFWLNIDYSDKNNLLSKDVEI